MFATVVTSSRAKGIGGGLTYESDTDLAIGSLVTVPLRKTVTEGIVIARALRMENNLPELKKIETALGTQPLLPPALAKTILWLSEYYLCPVRHALRIALPPPPWTALVEKEEETFHVPDGDFPVVRGTKQRAVLDYLTSRGPATFSLLREETGASRQTLTSLLHQGAVERKLLMPAASVVTVPPPVPPDLTTQQEDAIRQLFAEKRPTLLHDEPTSDRSGILRALIAATLRDGKSAIVLFPEIRSAEEYREAYAQEWDGDVFLVHGTLPLGARREQFRRIARSGQCVVIGTRSALFSPVKHLGLVIVVDEHDWSYKQMQSPRYHARLVAEVLCRHAEAKLVLTSATPSLESMRHAGGHSREPRFHLLRMKEKPKETGRVRVLDLTHANFGSSYPLTPPLLEAVGDRLKRGEQSLLFLNHRGNATAMLCLDCKATLDDPSGMPMTMYERKDGGRTLLNRMTGVATPVPDRCPACDSLRLYAVGAGTQRVESLLRTFFPDARIARADTDILDTTRKQRSFFAAMKERRIDIVVGTQLALKAAAFPSVTFSAALVADTGLSLPHVRAGERTVQLLATLLQTAMRENGNVLLQTFRPDAPEIRAVADGSVDGYLAHEQEVRKRNHEPPFTQVVALLCRGRQAREHALLLCAEVRKHARPEGDVEHGTAYASFSNPSLWITEVRGRNPRAVLRSLPPVYAAIDIDPLGCM